MGDAGSHGDQADPLGGRPRPVAPASLEAAYAAARNESDLGREVFFYVQVAQAGLEPASAVVQLHQPGSVAAIQIGIPCPGGIAAQVEGGLHQGQVEVHAGGAVVGGRGPGLLVDGDEAEVRAAQEVALEAQNGEVGPGDLQGVGDIKLQGIDDAVLARLHLRGVEQFAFRGDEAVLLGFLHEGHGPGGHAQGAHLVGSRTAGKLASCHHRQNMSLLDADAAAVKKNGWRPASAALPLDPLAEFENSRSFEEEIPLFGKEEAEPGKVDLLLVGFHLGEVGLVGQVQSQGGGETVLDVQPRVQVVLGGVAGADVPPRGAQQVGDQNQGRAAPKLAQSLQGGEARGPVASPETEGLGWRGDEDLLVFAADGAADVDAPNPLFRVRVAQLVERDGHFGAPAQAVDGGAALPDPVPGQVAGSALVGEQQVLARSQGIDAEEKSAAAVVEGIEDYLDVVVLLKVGVAPHVVGHQAEGLAVEAAQAEV